MSDSYNHIFKQSLNAFHNELISGGSSGGEGALVGVRGSLVGLGTDIGGDMCCNGSAPESLLILVRVDPHTSQLTRSLWLVTDHAKDSLGEVWVRDMLFEPGSHTNL